MADEADIAGDIERERLDVLILNRIAIHYRRPDTVTIAARSYLVACFAILIVGMITINGKDSTP